MGKVMENTYDNRADKHSMLKREVFWHVLKLALLTATMYLLFFDAIALKVINEVTDQVSPVGAPEDTVALLAVPFSICTVASLALFLGDYKSDRISSYGRESNA